MFHQTDIRTLQPGLTPFPADVFTPDQPWLADHLLPLISIDLGLLRPELAGTVATMLCPIEPYEGCLGEGTEAHHTAFTSRNWLSFELTEDNRLRFLGNERYFQRAPQNVATQGLDADLREHATEMRDSHTQARAAFLQHGRLCAGMDDVDDMIGEPFLDSLGGPFWYGNWTEYEPLPSGLLFEDLAGYTRRGRLSIRNDSDDLPDDGIRISRDGQPFFPVACVAAYHWCAAGADAILMFYEPHSRTVLFSYDWT